MDERKANILKAVVEQFIETAQPVGSTSLARVHGLGVSSATIRNEMTTLEREGYLAQPHTSAGRIPTDKGYRFFVDQLGRLDPGALPQQREVSDFFRRAHTALEDTLHETSLLLSRITDHTAMVIGPGVERAVVRSIQLVRIQPSLVLVIAVLSNGTVIKEAIELGDHFTALGLDDQALDDGVIAQATQLLHEALFGASLNDLPLPDASTSRLVDSLVATARNQLVRRASSGTDPLYIGGTSRIAAEAHDFGAEIAVARLLELLERQYLVVTLVRDLIDAGLTVRIGRENELAELSECSVVLAPYRIDDEVAGTVGVLGPKRMNYSKAMAAVASVSQRLGHHLSNS